MRFKAGKYYIGDLCYVIKDELWSELVEKHFDEGLETFKDVPVTMDSTAHGDGTYLDNEGNYYSVDSGTIGIVPVPSPIIDLDNLNHTVKNGFGHTHKFEKDFDVNFGYGEFAFGNVFIDTDPDDDDDDDDEYPY